MDLAALARALHEEARLTNERRVVVLTGERERGYEALQTLLDAVDVAITETTLVGPSDRLQCSHVEQSRTGELLGTTRSLVVLDAHEALRPNALGRVTGVVDGGGLLVLLAPPLDSWPTHRDRFDESMAVPPFSTSDVTGRFRSRLVETLRTHPGIAIVDIDDERVVRDGSTNPPPRLAPPPIDVPEEHAFPRAAFEACLTQDQVAALVAFEALSESNEAVVVEADRGRGKSSAAGLAAGSLALSGERVLVTAPGRRNADEVFARAGELLETVGAEIEARGAESADRDGGIRDERGRDERDRNGSSLELADGGWIRFEPPATAVDTVDDGGADVVVVDEAAALSVGVLDALLSAHRVAFTTTIHGYEGAGRGFSVRFRDRLAASDHAVTDVTMTDPIRYAAGDPVEVWAFRALLLDARPPVTPLIEEATPEAVEYRELSPDRLLADEQLLRETFGLLVLAHYRTEPADLARLLDAPNVSVRGLLYEGHVASVALLAREGGLDAETRAAMYEGARIRGNMLPDVLTSQLRDEEAGIPTGRRVMRIATHHAVRSRGLGSHLLSAIRDEVGDEVDWLATGYGATPPLLRFWRNNGYGAIHLSTTRNAASGEHSVLMVDARSEAGEVLHDRHASWFVDRVAGQLTDSLRDVDPDVVRAVLASVALSNEPNPDLTTHEWRVVTDAAYGPGLYAVAPEPFRRLVVAALVDDAFEALTPRRERLLVAKVLQGSRWKVVADALEFHSTSQCMRALGESLQPIVDRYAPTDVERSR